jgi:adenylate cyclase
MADLTLSEVARRVDVSPATLRRWVREGIVPLGNGRWTPAAVAHARIVARLRERGYSLRELREAARSGRLAYGYIEDLWPEPARTRTLAEAAEETGLHEALIERIWTTAGFSTEALDRIGEEDLQLLRYMAAVLDAGFPLVAFLQLVRVYAQALGQIADAEVKLFHLYVHEPLMREGVPGLEIAEAMEGLAAELLPLASPIMDHVHQRALQHFIGQDVVGHLELEAGAADLGRLRVAIAFADLAGYTRLTEEAGEEEAVDVVERFVESVNDTLPEDARVIKTIGDEAMVIGADPSALVDWAVGFQELNAGRRPLPRIGIHVGDALYRDGDYYGRAVNLASRVGARAAGGEVLVTEPVVAAAGRHLAFEPIGQVKLKGFTEATDLFLARGEAGDERSEAGA